MRVCPYLRAYGADVLSVLAQATLLTQAHRHG